MRIINSFDKYKKQKLKTDKFEKEDIKTSRWKLKQKRAVYLNRRQMFGL